LPMAESANSDYLAAIILAEVSGSDVPTATKVIAVTAALSPRVHPRTVATSATMAVIDPMKVRAIMKAGIPPPHSTGGMKAKSRFQPMMAKCVSASMRLTSSTIMSSSFTCGHNITAFLNLYDHDGFFCSRKYEIKLVCSVVVSPPELERISTVQQFFFGYFDLFFRLWVVDEYLEFWTYFFLLFFIFVFL